MQFKSIIATLAAVATVSAQNATANSTQPSICDKYTTALLKDNTAENQLMLLTLLVNTVVIGNYTQPNMNAVPGILAEGEVNGTKVNLLPYFDGGLVSTNRGGNATVQNFLDDGGAEPLKMNKPSNGNQNSNQYLLLTHLYQFFGTLLGCSKQGTSAYPSYQGQASMGQVHQFMDLTYAENTYFITQVALAAQSFGVSADDIKTVGTALNGLFNVRCAAPPADGPLAGATQSICQDNATCPLAPNNTCPAYINAVQPGVANATLAQGEGNASNTAGTGAAAPTSSKAAAAHLVGSGVAAGLGFLAFLL